MKKIVVKLDLHDDKAKQKAMKAVSTLSGIDSIAIDMKEQKLTVIGVVDPITVAAKLRKSWPAEIVSVGPPKEPEKKQGEQQQPKKEGGKEDQKKDVSKQHQIEEYWKNYYNNLYYQMQQQQHYLQTNYRHHTAEEDPNSCKIC